jgi:hypothetical protein
MPLTVSLRDSGITLLIQGGAEELEMLMKAMSGDLSNRKWKANGRIDRGTIIHLTTITGKACIVRADDITLIREITDEDVAKNKKEVEEAAEKEKRFQPAPQNQMRIVSPRRFQ